MNLSQEEIRILKDLSEKVTSPVSRGPKPADYAERQKERYAIRKKVGQLINRYEAYLTNQE